MENNAGIYQDVLNKFNGLLEVDPYIKTIAQEVSNQENPDPRCLPHLINAMREINENMKQTITNMPDEYMIPPDVNDTSRAAENRRKIQQSVANLQQLLNSEGYDILRERNTLTTERDDAKCKLEQAKVDLEDKQQRLKQAAQVVKNVYVYSTQPVRDDGTVGALGANVEVSNRVFPDGRSSYRMTDENFNRIMNESGIYDMDTLNVLIEKANEPTPQPSTEPTPESSANTSLLL